MSEAIATLDFDDFVAAEQRGDARHELVGGRVYATAGGSERHDLAAGIIFAALRPGARTRVCRAFTANRLLRTSVNSGYYPDVLVSCGKACNARYETDATVVVEARSPSTVQIDRREKASAYLAVTVTARSYRPFQPGASDRTGRARRRHAAP